MNETESTEGELAALVKKTSISSCASMRVLNTTELLEIILLCGDITTAVRLRGINATFLRMIRDSPRLRAHLYLQGPLSLVHPFGYRSSASVLIDHESVHRRSYHTIIRTRS